MSDFRADVINHMEEFILASRFITMPVPAKLLAQRIGEELSDDAFREAQQDGLNPTEMAIAVVLVFLGQGLRTASRIILQAGLDNPINPATFNN